MSLKKVQGASEISRPKVLVSRCIGFEHCRWNGDIIASPYIEKLKNHVDFITVCPESDIGLGVPRKPVRLFVAGSEIKMLQHETGFDVTDKMNSFSEIFFEKLNPVEGILFKERSPSCGMSNVKIYSGATEGASITRKGCGLFAARWKKAFPSLPSASEGHLYNYALREHFYTQIFTLARFRTIRTVPAIKNLVDFHARHKLILMSYNQTLMRQMGRLVANHENRETDEVFDCYFELLCSALGRQPRTMSPINVLMHALGYFSEKVSGGEKKFFLDLLEQYRQKKTPQSTCNAVIKSWIVRFDENYLATQFFFNPYPESLIELSDSGK